MPRMRVRLLALAAALAGCGAPAAAPPRLPLEAEVVPPRVLSPRVLPVDPAASRPELVDPVVRPPDLRDAVQIDSYVQRQATVDILFVVDDSGSMVDERERLAGSYQRFVQLLTSRADRIAYRIGVTSTQVADGGQNGRLRGPFLHNDTPDPTTVFAAQLRFEPGRVKLEQGLLAAQLALGADERGRVTNPGFLREQAALAVIFVSDEDDGSFGGTGHFARWLRSRKGPGNEELVSVSAIAGPRPDGCVPPGQEGVFGGEAEAAERYGAVVDATGGAFGSICQDFAPALERVVSSVRTLRRIFPLSLPPDLATLTVKVCPPEAAVCDDAYLVPRDPVNGWDYEPRLQAVVFPADEPPGPGSLVKLEYALAPDGSAP